MNGPFPADLVSEDSFKVGMQLLASTVTVITARYLDVRAGMTATAVCSLSASPPSLLACVNRQTRTYGFIMDSRRFAVNLISDDMKDVAYNFAGRGTLEEKFGAPGKWSDSASGVPIMRNGLATFECRVDRWLNTKTHAVFIGNVESITLDPDKRPLIYGQQQFQSLAALVSEGA